MTINTGETAPSLRMLCLTRWTVYHRSIETILRNYKTIQTTLEEIEKGKDEYATKARTLLSSMKLFNTIFALKLAYLFSAAEQLPVHLQVKGLTIQKVLNFFTHTSHHRDLKNYLKHFIKFFKI